MAQTKTQKLLPRAKTPEEVGVSSSELVEFLRDMEENGLEFHSFMIIRHGKVAAECYRAPFNAETPHTMYSVSKTFSATAVGFAVHEGIFSLDTRVIDVFPEYAPKKPCERLQKLTVRHLVTMTSGKNPSLLADKGKIDWIEDYINCPWYGDPGEYRYVNENVYMLCAIISRLTGQSVREFLTPRLFEPLGIDVPFWETDKNGVEAGGWGSYFKTEDLAKVMLCYHQDGKFNGKQVIPEQWAKEAHTALSDNSFCNDLDAQFGYGYCIWRNGGCRESYRADGMFSQFGIVFEDYDAVFTSTGAIPVEQIARDCVWRHFPKAFIDADEGKDTAVSNLKEILSSSPIDVPVISSHSPREVQLEGKTIKMRKKLLLNLIGFPLSVLPLGVTYMTMDKAGNIDDISFSFGENECSMFWTEGDESNTVICGMDGHQRYGTMRLGQIDYSVCCTAEWKDDDTLYVQIRPVTTVAKRMLTFKFNATNKVTMIPSSTPAVSDIAEFLGVNAGDLISNKFVVKLVKKVLKVVPSILEPKHKGRIV